MDILYSDKVNGYCIVSSDSDFTRLATRLREAGMKVYGFGEKKTPQPFITACDKFIYVEILKAETPLREPSEKPKSKQKQEHIPLKKVDPEVVSLIMESVADITDETGWAYLGSLGILLSKKKPDFDSRNYGFPKLLLLIRSLKKFEIDERVAGSGNIKHIYLKLK